MNGKLKYGLIGLLIGIVVTWGLTPAVLSTNSQDKTSSKSLARSDETLDAHFIEQMIPHHEDAVTMAKLAQENAKRPEVKQLAQNIIDSQGNEIYQMKVWYKDWFGKDLPTGSEIMNQHGMMRNNNDMHMGVRGDESDISTLEQADDFDIMFVEQMIPHHQMAVMMASMLQQGTTRPEMRRLADDIITTQTSEIEQMRTWLREWK